MSKLNLNILIAVWVLMIALTGQAAAKTIYVDPNGSADFNSIQAAINDPCTVDNDEIEVAPATYYESINFIGKAVRLYSSGGPEVTIIDANGAYHAVQCVSSEDANTILEGFTVTDGNANGSSWGEYYGGGMLNNVSNPTVKNCIFSGNAATAGGGGMFNHYCSPTVTNCTFSWNATGANGGGIYNWESGPNVTNCTFRDNTAQYGGGMFNDSNSNSTVTDCNFNENEATISGGGMFNNSSWPKVSGCDFYSNQAINNDGGGMCNQGSSPDVVNCNFSDNSASSSGGGMLNYNDSSPTITNCTFSGNSAVNNGGGMINWINSNPTVTNCIFSGNSAAYGGGMLNAEVSSPTVTNCTFTKNSAYDDGGGICNDNDSNPTVTNCILWNDSPDEIYNDTSTPTVTYCDVQGGYSGTGNINADPCFVDDTNPDPNLWNLRLKPDSPCIDTADNSSIPADTVDLDNDGNITEPIPYDLDGYPRIFDGDVNGTFVVDMGAYEYNFFVAHNVTQDQFYVLVQAAIDDANDGDQIEVWPGTHYESINFIGKAIRLYSSGGPDVTTIDGTGYYHVVQCVSGEDANTILEGFTITGGYAYHSSGGGMYNYYSSPTVTNCAFSDNSASDYGGGMYNSNSSPTVTNCTFTGNSASDYGGGMENYSYSSPTVTNCTFRDNTAQYGSGMDIWDYSNPTVTNCTFTSNSASSSGGGMYNTVSGSSTVTNCIFWDDTAPTGPEIYGSSTVTYSDIQGGYTGTGNIDADPCFVDADANDFRLLLDSPCIDAGDNSVVTEPNDLAGNPRIVDGDDDSTATVDMGAYELLPTSICNVTQGIFYITIQEAIDGANTSNEIEVLPGTCNEAINFNGKAIRLYSSGGPDVTTIDGTGNYHVVQCVSGEDANTILEGFTITGGDANGSFPDNVGSGMYNSNSCPTVTNCIFCNNSANNGGGGMFNESGSSPAVTNCIFRGNSSNYGAGMWNYGSSPTLTNCTFSANTGVNVGGMYNEYGSNSAVTNCIFWGDSPVEISNSSSTPLITYCDVQGGYSGTGNIDADPCFVDADANDFRLLYDSPCIDAGDNNSVPPDTADLDGDANTTEPIPYDLDGRPRFVDGDCNTTIIVDMGAYEFTYAYFGDFDSDCDVDFIDFAIQADFWLTDQFLVDIAPTPAGDGLVDSSDLAVLCDNWLAGAE